MVTQQILFFQEIQKKAYFWSEKMMFFYFFLIELVLVRCKNKIIIMNKFRENDHKITEPGAG